MWDEASDHREGQRGMWSQRDHREKREGCGMKKSQRRDEGSRERIWKDMGQRDCGQESMIIEEEQRDYKEENGKDKWIIKRGGHIIR